MKVRNIACWVWGLYMSLCHVDGFPQGSGESAIGDPCTLKDGSKGECIIDRNCAFVLDLLKKNKLNEIVKCGFMGKSQIVCCKNTSSTKFENALCEGRMEKRPKNPPRFTQYIINGEKSDIAEFPHMAALGYESEGDQFDFNCGGTLIAEDFVLTAAHCVNRKDLKPIMVRLGKTSLKDDLDEQTAQDVNIKEIIIHSNYSSRSKLNDIALLKLEKTVKLTHNVWPACISSKTEGSLNNLTIIGFGRIEIEDQTKKSDWLLKASAEEFSLKECQTKFNEIGKPITQTQICVHSPKTFSDTCQGDSGGPLEYKKNNLQYVYGITSYGLACGNKNYPSIYTRVDMYLDWIKEKMGS